MTRLAVTLAVVLAWACALAVQTHRLHRAEMALVAAQAEAAGAEAAAEREARKVEAERAAAAERVAHAFEEGKTHAQEHADRVVAELNAGALRLRQQWAGCETQRLSDSALATRELDAALQQRAESAGRIVRAAAECDAHVSALQALVRADRGLEPADGHR